MEYINEFKVPILRNKIIESITILKDILYDKQGNLISNNVLLDEEEKMYSINLLHDYEEILKKLSNNERIYSKIKCLKKKIFPYKKNNEINNKRDEIYSIDIPNKGKVNGVYRAIQCFDGSYHDIVVLYNGFSDVFHTSFICFYDLHNKKLFASSIINFNDNLIWKDCDNKEMLESFTTQFLNDTTLDNKLQSIPNIILYSKIKQYEEYDVGIAIGGNKKENLQLFKNDSKDEQENYNLDKMYHYVARFSSEELYEKVIIELKEANPNLIVYGEKYGLYDSLKNKFKDEKFIISLSSSISEINEPKNVFRRGRNSYIINALSNITDDDYNTFKERYNKCFSKITDECAIKIFVDNLIKSNCGCQISYKYDEEKEIYKLISNVPYSKLNYNDFDTVYNVFRIDKNGYILDTNFNMIKYECIDGENCDKKIDMYVDKDELSNINNRNSVLLKNNNIENMNYDTLKKKYLQQQQQIIDLENRIIELEQVINQNKIKNL